MPAATTVTGDGRRTRERLRPLRKIVRARTRGSTLLAAALLSAAGCDSDFVLSASNLQIGPNPARPGDQVVASFIVTLVPTQPHTILVMIDGAEHLRVSSDEAPAVPTLLDLGDAGDLIETYGSGEHAAHVEVHLTERGEVARSQSAIFELRNEGPGALPRSKDEGGSP